jgi:hypothetical protein
MTTKKLVQKPLFLFIIFVFVIMFFAPPVKAEQCPPCTQALMVWQKAAVVCLQAIKYDLKTGLDTMDIPCGDSLHEKEQKMYEICEVTSQTLKD